MNEQPTCGKGVADLPTGRHDAAALSSPIVVEAFAEFVKLQQELLALLEKSIASDREMLASTSDVRTR